MESLKRQLEQEESLQLLHRIAEQIAGAAVPVRIELGGSAQHPAPPRAAAAAPLPAAESKPVPSRPSRKRRPSQDSAPNDGLLNEARKEPGVRKLLDTFGAQVVEIGPLELSTDPAAEPED